MSFPKNALEHQTHCTQYAPRFNAATRTTKTFLCYRSIRKHFDNRRPGIYDKFIIGLLPCVTLRYICDRFI